MYGEDQKYLTKVLIVVGPSITFLTYGSANYQDYQQKDVDVD